MVSQSFARGAFLALVAAFFGLNAMSYSVGSFVRAGPGLFPLIVSGTLAVLAVIVIVQSLAKAGPALRLPMRSVTIIMAALISFVLLSKYLSMPAGIAALVAVASFAGTDVSWKRNAMVAGGLMLIAYGFQHLLGLNLGLV